MIGIRCEKPTIEKYMHVLGTGHGDISEPPEGWTAAELLTLAGCCFAVVLRQGPQLHGVLGADMGQLHEGRREYSPDQLNRDVHSAIEFCQRLAIEAADQNWDKKFGPLVRASVEAKAAGGANLLPIEGFKENWQS